MRYRTSSTDERRTARSAPAGTSKGTCASARVRLARTMRWATVGSGTRWARAISSVVRPPSRRSVIATLASGESTGWQAVNMRLRRSSPRSSLCSIAASRSGTIASCCAASSSCLRSASLARRSRSMARCLPVAMSQAPGLSGTPDSGHCSRAARSASWATSSAIPMSRTIRARPATSFADSILQTASIARCVSATVTSGLRRPRLQLLAQLLLAGGLLGREDLRRKVRRLVHLADLDHALHVLAHGGGAALDPLDRLFPRLHLDEPEAGNQFLRLGERPVGHRPLAPGERDPGTLGGRLEPLARQHHASFHHLLVVPPHRSKELLAALGENAGLGVLGRPDHQHEAHRPASSR